MLEAVNSVISNAPLLRLNADQTSSAASIDSDISVATAPEAPYVSPYVYVDNNYNKAVIQIRDSDTGDVLNQFPSTETLASRARAAQAAERREEVQRELTAVQPEGGRTAEGASSSSSSSSIVDTPASFIDVQGSRSQASSAPAPAQSTSSVDVVSAAISAAQSSGAPATSGTAVSFQA